MKGSSPRVWGQEKYGLMRGAGSGIIPTRVGTSAGVDTSIPFQKDHPHACGDKQISISLLAKSPGSSPRVWGQVRNNLKFDSQLKDHPHACGDKGTYAHCTGIMQGSSPRVWGQVYEAQDNAMNYRIIPTRVGTRRYCFAVAQQS